MSTRLLVLTPEKTVSCCPCWIEGNDDCGQMSAWYLFSPLGFYPVAPGANHYQSGSPAIEKATILLEN